MLDIDVIEKVDIGVGRQSRGSYVLRFQSIWGCTRLRFSALEV